MSLFAVAGFVVLCVLLEGFFSGGEIALLNADRLKLKNDARNGSLGAALALKMLSKPHYFISTTLMGTNLMVVAASTVLTMYFIALVGGEAEAYAVAILSPLVLVFGEMTPKMIYQSRANAIAPVIAYPMIFFYYLFGVFSRPLSYFGYAVSYIVSRGKPMDYNSLISREEVRRMIESDDITAGSDLLREEKRMVANALEFGGKTAGEIMVPLIEVTGLNADMTVADAMPTALDEEFSRYPVYEERVDEIIGVVSAYDMLSRDSLSVKLRDVMRKAFYAPATVPLDKLLPQMQKKREQMAVIVDEFGGAIGIVSMEDVLEEIVGEIEDEYDDEEDAPIIKQIDKDKLFMDARVEVSSVNDIFPGMLPESDDYATLGGYVTFAAMRIPQAGEEINAENGLRIQIMESSERAVKSVLLTVPQSFLKKRLRKKQIRKEFKKG